MGNDGAQYAARALSHEKGVEIDVEYLASTELGSEAEQAHIRQAITAEMDGLIVSAT